MNLTEMINNLPTNYTDYTWIVARNVDDQLWFFGAWEADRKEEAEAQARMVNGCIVRVEV